jgi:hypothetical protein
LINIYFYRDNIAFMIVFYSNIACVSVSLARNLGRAGLLHSDAFRLMRYTDAVCNRSPWASAQFPQVCYQLNAPSPQSPHPCWDRPDLGRPVDDLLEQPAAELLMGELAATDRTPWGRLMDQPADSTTLRAARAGPGAGTGAPD